MIGYGDDSASVVSTPRCIVATSRERRGGYMVAADLRAVIFSC